MLYGLERKDRMLATPNKAKGKFQKPFIKNCPTHECDVMIMMMKMNVMIMTMFTDTGSSF